MNGNQFKSKLVILLGCIGILSGCNALDGKCDYLPATPDNCSCSKSPADPTYYSCNCRDYLSKIKKQDLHHCGKCSCVGNTCNDCWSCGKNYKFQDESYPAAG